MLARMSLDARVPSGIGPCRHPSMLAPLENREPLPPVDNASDGGGAVGRRGSRVAVRSRFVNRQNRDAAELSQPHQILALLGKQPMYPRRPHPLPPESPPPHSSQELPRPSRVQPEWARRHTEGSQHLLHTLRESARERAPFGRPQGGGRWPRLGTVLHCAGD